MLFLRNYDKMANTDLSALDKERGHFILSSIFTSQHIPEEDTDVRNIRQYWMADMFYVSDCSADTPKAFFSSHENMII